jgi:hypothetical protein
MSLTPQAPTSDPYDGTPCVTDMSTPKTNRYRGTCNLNPGIHNLNNAPQFGETQYALKLHAARQSAFRSCF